MGTKRAASGARHKLWINADMSPSLKKRSARPPGRYGVEATTSRFELVGFYISDLPTIDGRGDDYAPSDDVVARNRLAVSWGFS